MRFDQINLFLFLTISLNERVHNIFLNDQIQNFSYVIIFFLKKMNDKIWSKNDIACRHIFFYPT